MNLNDCFNYIDYCVCNGGHRDNPQCKKIEKSGEADDSGGEVKWV